MSRLSASEWEAARRACTPAQLRVLNYWRRGWGTRSIACVLDLDRSTIRHHVRAGLRNAARELERDDELTTSSGPSTLSGRGESAA